MHKISQGNLLINEQSDTRRTHPMGNSTTIAGAEESPTADLSLAANSSRPRAWSSPSMLIRRISFRIAGAPWSRQHHNDQSCLKETPTFPPERDEERALSVSRRSFATRHQRTDLYLQQERCDLLPRPERSAMPPQTPSNLTSHAPA